MMTKQKEAKAGDAEPQYKVGDRVQAMDVRVGRIVAICDKWVCMVQFDGFPKPLACAVDALALEDG